MAHRTSRQDLLNSLNGLAGELGCSPSQKDINDHTSHSHKTYYRKFDGGLQEAKEHLGLEHHEQQGRDRVEVECANCGETIEKTPSDVEAAEFNFCSQSCHYQHNTERYAGEKNPVSTLEEVECANCGEEILRAEWQRERVNRHYCSYECMEKPKVTLECDWCEEDFAVVPSLAETRRFCSRRCEASWKSKHQTGENHPRWRGGYEQYYGPTWPSQRRKALRRDQYRCQDCRMTLPESLEDYGEELHVHHLTRVNDFKEDGVLDDREANALDNLVTLCRPCHMLREGSANRLNK